MVTIKEIADLANVSRGTVDRVLNNRGSVNPQTARKVREIAQTLGYKPNKAGMALAAQKKKLRIGVILFGPENPFFQRVLEGVSAKAEELAAYDRVIVAGDGARLFAPLFPAGKVAPPQRQYVTGQGVALAAQKQKTIPAAALMPVYLRLSQAERQLKLKKGES